MMRGSEVYEKVTKSILKDLKKGTAPWLRPWSGPKITKKTVPISNIWPHNGATGRYYGGSNVLICWMHMAELKLPFGEKPPAFLTEKQVTKLGGKVRSREKPAFIIGYSSGTQTIVRDGEEQTRSWAAAYGHAVYHVSQCSGIKKLPEHKKVISIIEKDIGVGLDEKKWNIFTKKVGANVKHGGNTACYHVLMDTIYLPSAKRFATAELYKEVYLHELSHWTGHRSRLNRDLSSMHGTTGYAVEELIAEIGCAFLAARLGIPRKKLKHSEYIGNWIQALENDPKWVIRAASKAAQAADYIFNLLEKPTERKKLK